jgi:dolichol-phosphate mannosyltransferase
MKISVVIPAYNEAEGVAKTSQSLQHVLGFLSKEHDVEVIFVNDGSRDHTGQLLKQFFVDDSRVRVISHDVNRGLGAAIRTGFSHASGDIIITTDFDGTYSFDTIPQLLERLVSEKVDIVTASPYHPQGIVEGVPGYRLLFSFGASLLYRVLVNRHIHTWTALFRAYRKPVIDQVRFENDGFLAGTELLVHAIQQGFSVSEFPTILRVRTFGQSSIKIARVTKAHLKFQAYLLRSAIVGHMPRSGSLVRRHL